jgi:hypothetical protein
MRDVRLPARPTLWYTPAVLDLRFPALAEYRAHLPRGTPASPVCS